MLVVEAYRMRDNACLIGSSPGRNFITYQVLVLENASQAGRPGLKLSFKGQCWCVQG